MTDEQLQAAIPAGVTLESIEAEARELLSRWFAYAEIPEPQFPISTQAVVELMDKIGYLVSADLILGWVQQKLIHTPAMENGRWRWHARNVVQVQVNLDAWRRWQPLHPLHWPKLNQFERLQAEAEQAGLSTGFRNLDFYGIHELLVMIEGSENLHHRQAIRQIITCKLKAGESL